MKRRKRSNSGRISSPERRRRPVTVTGPYLVYMLKDIDIIDDWTVVKKVRWVFEEKDGR